MFPVQSGWNLDWDIGAMEDKHPESKVKVKVRVTQLCLTLCDPMDYTVHGILQARILGWVEPFPSPGNLPNSGIEPPLQEDSLPAEPPRKPKNTAVDSYPFSSGSS